MQQVFGTNAGAQGNQGALGVTAPNRDLFKVEKDWDNAPAGYLESEAPRAKEIRRLMRA